MVVGKPGLGIGFNGGKDMKYYTRVFLSVIPIMACIKTCSISDLHEQFPNAKNIHKIHVQTKKYMFLAIKTGDTDEKHMDKNLILVIMMLQ